MIILDSFGKWVSSRPDTTRVLTSFFLSSVIREVHCMCVCMYGERTVPRGSNNLKKYNIFRSYLITWKLSDLFKQKNSRTFF